MRPYLLLIASLVVTDAGLAAESVELAQSMQRAVLIDQNPEQIRALVKDGFDINDPVGCGTFSALDGAVTKENPEILELLLSLGAKPKERQLVGAAFAQDHAAGLKMVRLLRNAGVSINARSYHSEKKEIFSTALTQAVWRENVELVRYLINERADLDELDWGERTALMIAAEKRNAQIFDLLLEAGAGPAVTNRNGHNAIAIMDAAIGADQSMREKMLGRLNQSAHAAP